MKKNILIPCMLLLALLTAGCQKEGMLQNCDGETAQNIETFYAEEFENIPCRLQNIGNDKKGVNLVITNQAEFDVQFKN